jgi:hypothetical protein
VGTGGFAPSRRFTQVGKADPSLASAFKAARLFDRAIAEISQDDVSV